VLGVLGRETVDAITDEDVATLLGLATAIRDGESTVEQAFPPLAPPAGSAASATAEAGSRADALAHELAGAAPPETTPETP
jgi:hypothetical protein